MINRIVIFILLIVSINTFANDSIYVDQLNLKDEKNELFNLKKMLGKKVLVSMAYTSCQGTCPMIVSRMQKLEKKLNAKNIFPEVVIITYDPEFDTPAHMTDYYREKMGIKNTNWHFLVGTESDSRMSSLLLGIKYSRNAETKVVIHDNKIILLDEEGKIKSRVESFQDDDSKIIDD